MDIVTECQQERNFLLWVKKESSLATERQRASILLACAAGLSQRTIEDAVGCSRSTVVRTYRRWRQQKGWALVDKRRFGSTTHPVRAILDLLPTLCADTPPDYGWGRSRWTVELLTLEVNQQLGCDVSTTQMHRYLKQAGCHWKRPHPTIDEDVKPEDVDEQIDALDETIETIGQTDRELVLYADEVKLQLNPQNGSVWMPPGERKERITPGWNPTRYVSAVYNPNTEHMVWAMADSNDSDLFEVLLRMVADRYRGWRTIHLVVDNYSVHTSKQTQRVVDDLNGKVERHFLPSYCPEVNPIERVWWDLHDHVTRNHRCDDLDALSFEVYDYLRTRAYEGVESAGLRRTSA